MTVELLKEREMRDVIAAAYRKSKEQVGLPKEQMVNYVKVNLCLACILICIFCK